MTSTTPVGAEPAQLRGPAWCGNEAAGTNATRRCAGSDHPTAVIESTCYSSAFRPDTGLWGMAAACASLRTAAPRLPSLPAPPTTLVAASGWQFRAAGGKNQPDGGRKAAPNSAITESVLPGRYRSMAGAALRARWHSPAHAWSLWRLQSLGWFPFRSLAPEPDPPRPLRQRLAALPGGGGAGPGSLGAPGAPATGPHRPPAAALRDTFRSRQFSGKRPSCAGLPPMGWFCSLRRRLPRRGPFLAGGPWPPSMRATFNQVSPTTAVPTSTSRLGT